MCLIFRETSANSMLVWLLLISISSFTAHITPNWGKCQHGNLYLSVIIINYKEKLEIKKRKDLIVDCPVKHR